MSGTAVAISTTGDEHRIKFLETCVRYWDSVLSTGDALFVTVDGDERACDRVTEAVLDITGSVFRVGALYEDRSYGFPPRPYIRQGVAVNKNTGLELMMDNTRAEHLFLCDDDTYPRSRYALDKHRIPSNVLPHSMVCWGANRLMTDPTNGAQPYARWTWPRGVLLYQTRPVVDQVGGMVEAFGAGGHEHAEYSRRIHQHGLTPWPYCSPLMYAMLSSLGPASRAHQLWHCEDMRKPGETGIALSTRRQQITTVTTTPRDWRRIDAVMAAQNGNTDYVPFRAHENGRASATLCVTSTGRGAGGEL